MFVTKSTLLCLCTLLASAASFSQTTNVRSTTSLKATPVARDDFLKSMAVAVGGSAVLSGVFPGAAFAAEEVTLPSGVTYIVKKVGNGPKPDSGELCAIRFAAYAGSNKIDDIFETPEPYYTRVGSGGLIKGVESTLPLMRVGDRWELTVPVSTSCSYEMFAGHDHLIGQSINGWL